MKLATVKEVVNQAALEIGTAQVPLDRIYGSSDQDVVQMAALLNAVADEILLEEPYRTTIGDQAWAQDADGNPLIVPTQDTDLVLFDRRLAIDGIKYQFLAAKGLEFGEQLRAFTVRLNKIAGRVNGKILDLDDPEDREL
jgi:hypothetical protein